MLELKNVSKYYSSNGMIALGLRNINLKFESGEIVAITGDSGSGKSTLLNVITAVDTYEEGEIYFEGNETSYFNQNDMDEFRKNNVSFIFQNYNIIESYTVLQNVVLPLLLRGIPYEQAKTEATEIIEKVGLIHRIKHRGSRLSGGEKQRCVIARALASDAKILACDEPTGNLDSQTGDEIIQLIKEVSNNKLVLIVTHNYDQVKDIVTRKIKISDGEVVEDIAVNSKEETIPESDPVVQQQKLRLSSFFRIIFQNLITTPKRTFFSVLVFLIVSIFSLLLCLMTLQYSYEIGNVSNDYYGVITQDELIAYNALHQGMDKEKLEAIDHYEMYQNGFYDSIDVKYYIPVPKWGTGDLKARYTHHKLNYTIIEGRDYDPKAEQNEIVLVLPEGDTSYGVTTYYKYVDNPVYYSLNDAEVRGQKPDNKKIGVLVGVALSKEITTSYFQCASMPEQVLNYSINSQIEGYYLYNGEKEYMPKITYFTSYKTFIACPLAYKEEFTYGFMFAGLYSVRYDIEVVYTDKVANYPVVVLSDDYLLGEIVPQFDEIFEATIYSHHPKKAKSQLNRAGIDVTMPSREENPSINISVLYLFIGIILFSLICLFFISYIILSRLYASKNKEYGILRTLGLVQQKLGRMVIFENTIIGLASAVLGLVIYVIVDSIYPIMNLREYMSFGVVSIYFIIVLLFSLLIARKFNKRLFKFSVNTTLKGEVARND